MKIDLGNYKYCEDSDLEELCIASDKTAKYKGFPIKINGTLYKTELGNYVFYGAIISPMVKAYSNKGWCLLNKEFARFILSVCFNINDENKWTILDYEKV